MQAPVTMMGVMVPVLVAMRIALLSAGTELQGTRRGRNEE